MFFFPFSSYAILCYVSISRNKKTQEQQESNKQPWKKGKKQKKKEWSPQNPKQHEATTTT